MTKHIIINMNPDENNGGIPPTNEDIIEVKQGEQDPLDAITDVEELRKAAKANRAIASRYKKDAKATPPAASTTPPVPSTPLPKTEVPQNSTDKTYSREELNLRIDGWSDEEVAFIVRNGGAQELANPKSIAATTVKAMREQREAEIAASRTNANGSGSGTVESKYTLEQLNAMSAAELAKVLPHA